MVVSVAIQCQWCKAQVFKPKKEVARQQRAGKQNFYCNSSCAAHCINSRSHVREMLSQNARVRFGPLIHDPYHASKAKFGQEKWKYQELMEALWQTDVKYMFEYPLLNEEGRVRLYDLCLPEQGLLIEFDGKYHNRSIYFHRDNEKDTLAEFHGWSLVRIPVLENAVIPADCLIGIIHSQVSPRSPWG